MESANPIAQGSHFVGKAKKSLFDRLPKLPLYVWLIIIFVVGILITLGIYFLVNKLRSGREEINGENNISIPFKPTPKPLAHGKQTYFISGSKTGAPKIAEATIDPIDPQNGENQKFSTKALSLENGAVSAVKVTIITDNEQKTFPLNLTSGTAEDGVWEGNWVITDTYDYTYQAVIAAENASSGWEITLTFR
jgi:hypothetical protein